MKMLAIVPARAGSTGIPNKNLKAFCGKPLITYTLDTAKKSKEFDRIVVSTDSKKIAAVARARGAEVPYLRPKRLATSTANVVDAVLHMLDYLKRQEGYEPDVIVLLQPTSPLRDAGDIRKALATFKKGRTPALVSVCRTHHQILRIERGVLRLVSRGTRHVNRQELPQTYRQDGSMIYVVDTAFFRKHRTFMPEGKTAAYIVPKWKAVDLDTPEDLRLAEVLYKNRRYFPRV